MGSFATSSRGRLVAASSSSLNQEVAATLRIGGPLALGELGWMSTYIVDALMIGRLPHSALSIAASSLGNTIYYAIAFFMIYMMNGLETFVSQAYGRGDRQEGVRMLGQSMWIVLVGTPLIMLLTMGSVYLLPLFHTPPEVVGEAHRYLSALIWGTAPLMLYMALRRYLQSINHVLLISASLITASLVNWLGDYAFLFGHFGAHAMGVAGSGWGTCIVRVWMLALLLAGTYRALRSQGQRLSWSLLKPDAPRLKALLRIGWPSGLEESTELATSTCLSLMCVALGTKLLAAHQVVLDLTAFIYMVPQGLSYAAMIRVGQAAGRDDLRQVRRANNVAMTMGLGFIAAAALVFGMFGHFWAGLYTNDPGVALAAAPITVICGFQLLGDVTFVFLAASLTGLGDTRSPMLVSLVSNWILGMPLAYVLAFPLGGGLRGLWIGRAIASMLTAVLLMLCWQWRLRKAAGTGRVHSLHMFTPAAAK